MVFAHELIVRKLGYWIFVQTTHVGVSGCGVQVEVFFFHCRGNIREGKGGGEEEGEKKRQERDRGMRKKIEMRRREDKGGREENADVSYHLHRDFPLGLSSQTIFLSIWDLCHSTRQQRNKADILSGVKKKCKWPLEKLH